MLNLLFSTICMAADPAAATIPSKLHAEFFDSLRDSTRKRDKLWNEYFAANDATEKDFTKTLDEYLQAGHQLAEGSHPSLPEKFYVDLTDLQDRVPRFDLSIRLPGDVVYSVKIYLTRYSYGIEKTVMDLFQQHAPQTYARIMKQGQAVAPIIAQPAVAPIAVPQQHCTIRPAIPSTTSQFAKRISGKSDTGD